MSISLTGPEVANSLAAATVFFLGFNFVGNTCTFYAPVLAEPFIFFDRREAKRAKKYSDEKYEQLIEAINNNSTDVPQRKVMADSASKAAIDRASELDAKLENVKSGWAQAGVFVRWIAALGGFAIATVGG